MIISNPPPYAPPPAAAAPDSEPSDPAGALSIAAAERDALLGAVAGLMLHLTRSGELVGFRPDPDQPVALQDPVVGSDIREQPLDPAFTRRILDEVARTLDAGERRTVAYELPDSEGGSRHYEARLVPSGEDRVVVLVCDVTERKRAEAALRESGERYRRIVETATEGVWMIDAEARTTFVNARMAEMLGYEADEMVGMPLDDFLDAEGRRMAAENLERRRAGIAEQHDFRFRRKDGEDLWTWMSTTPLTGEDGNYLGALAMVTDITDRRRAEREHDELRARLHRSERLESVGKLAGGVAHDFNNLLGVILNYSDFVAQAVEDDPKLREDVEQIQYAAQRAAELTRQLLVLGRRDTARPRVLDLNEVVAATEKLLSSTLGEHIRFVTRLAPDLRRVEVDPGQIEQVLVNLAVNARDAMPSGGTLTIRSENATVGATDPAAPDLPSGEYARLSVIDTGVGMTRAVLDRALEPFFTTKVTGAGTGLGLATTYGIVRHAGGAVAIASRPGRGTTVEVLLPASARDAEPERDAGPPPAPRPGMGETVLVVEDEEAVRRSTCRILAAHGYRVLEAENGDEALVVCDRHTARIDLLLTDMLMPHMSGAELARRVRKLRPRLKVVYMSGYADRDGTLEDGALLLEKPFMATTLLSGITEALRPLDDEPAPGPAER